MQVLKNTSATIPPEVLASEIEADFTAATVTISRANGTVIVTNAAAPNGSYVLAAQYTSSLDVLSAVWSYPTGSITSTVEIIGAVLFSLQSAIEFDQAQLSAAEYTTAKLKEARERITDAFENICNVSFVPRYSL